MDQDSAPRSLVRITGIEVHVDLFDDGYLRLAGFRHLCREGHQGRFSFNAGYGESHRWTPDIHHRYAAAQSGFRLKAEIVLPEKTGVQWKDVIGAPFVRNTLKGPEIVGIDEKIIRHGCPDGYRPGRLVRVNSLAQHRRGVSFVQVQQ